MRQIAIFGKGGVHVSAKTVNTNDFTHIPSLLRHVTFYFAAVAIRVYTRLAEGRLSAKPRGKCLTKRIGAQRDVPKRNQRRHTAIRIFQGINFVFYVGVSLFGLYDKFLFVHHSFPSKLDRDTALAVAMET